MSQNSEDADPLAGRWFQITRIVEHCVDVGVVEGTVPTAWFLNNHFFVETGGNRVHSAYVIDAEGRLVAEDIVQTLVKTGGAVLAQERRIKRAFAAKPTIELSGRKLTIEGGEVTLFSVEVPRPPSPAPSSIRR